MAITKKALMCWKSKFPIKHRLHFYIYFTSSFVDRLAYLFLFIVEYLFLFIMKQSRFEVLWTILSRPQQNCML